MKVYIALFTAVLIVSAANQGASGAKAGSGSNTSSGSIPSGIVPPNSLVTGSPYIDSSAYSSLAAADVDAYTSGKKLRITTHHAINSAVTFSSYVEVDKVSGGAFTRTGSGILNFAGGFEAGDYQIFSGFDSGLTFHKTQGIKPVWFGAKGDGVSDDSSVLTQVIVHAAVSRVPLMLGASTYGIAGPVVYSGTGSLEIVSNGAVIRALPVYAPAGALVKLSGVEAAGPLRITYGDKKKTVAVHAVASLAADARQGDTQIIISNTSGIAVGDLLELRAQRLWFYDSRNQTYVGELLRVAGVNGNEVTIESGLAFSYTTGTIYSGRAAGGSASTINLSSIKGIDPALILGCRVTITGGTGAGQVRYISSYDAKTAIATIDTSSSHPQAAFNPAPDHLSRIEIDAQPYIIQYRPATIKISGKLTVDCAGVPNARSGVVISMSDAPAVEGLTVLKGYRSGMYVNHSYNPSVVNYEVRDSSSQDDTYGYGMAFQGCRNAVQRGFRAYNCRRASDAFGTIPTVGAEISNFFVDGGRFQHDGDEWGPDKRSTGLGGHGPAWEYTYRDGTISNVHTGIILRGGFETVENVHFVGEIGICVLSLKGESHVVRNNRYSARQAVRNLPMRSTWRWGRNDFMQLSPGGYTGPIVVENNRVEGLRGNFVYFANAKTLPVYSKYIIRNNSGTLNSDKSVVAEGKFWPIDAENLFIADKCDFSGNIFIPGGAAATLGLARTSTGGTPPNWYKVAAGTYIIAVGNDKAIAIPAYSGAGVTQQRISIYQSNSDTTYRMDAIVREGSASFSTTFSSTAGFTGAIPPFTGTTNAGGSIYVGLKNGMLEIENRSGTNFRAVASILGGF